MVSCGVVGRGVWGAVVVVFVVSCEAAIVCVCVWLSVVVVVLVEVCVWLSVVVVGLGAHLAQRQHMSSLTNDNHHQ